MAINSSIKYRLFLALMMFPIFINASPHGLDAIRLTKLNMSHLTGNCPLNSSQMKYILDPNHIKFLFSQLKPEKTTPFLLFDREGETLVVLSYHDLGKIKGGENRLLTTVLIDIPAMQQLLQLVSKAGLAKSLLDLRRGGNNGGNK